MTKSAANRNRSRTQPDNPVEKSADDSSRGPVAGWAWSQIGRNSFFFLAVCVIAQLATILITWPAWQVRTSPPNLPWVASTPQISTGILLIVTLAFTLISPRKAGFLSHLVVLAVAIGMDQFRCQPQVLAITFMMAACVYPTARRLCVWYLVVMWLWAGIHKLASPDWTMHVSFQLLSSAGMDARKIHYPFAIMVAISEVGQGLLAWFKPRLGAIGCLGLHLGITLFLLLIGWNFSVLPWNISTAIIGAWLLWTASHERSPMDEPKTAVRVSVWQRRLRLPSSAWERVVVVLLFIVPVGVYFGWVRHCFSHTLYSDNLPQATVTRFDGIETIESWDQLRFPFPNECKSYRDYFSATSGPGEKLHIRDPRIGMPDYYFVKEPTGSLKQISRERFFENGAGQVAGIGQDDPRVIYRLEKANVTLLKRSKEEMVYAIKFEPKSFEPELLNILSGLPNLEQIQLANCQLADKDLETLNGMKKLVGIGLNHTDISDDGLTLLTDVPNLIVIEHAGTNITPTGLQRLGILVTETNPHRP